MSKTSSNGVSLALFVASPVQHADLTEEVMFREELMLVTAPALRNPDDLGKQRDLKIIVFRRGCSYRQRLENILAQRGIQTAQPLEFSSLDAIIGCVAAGAGHYAAAKGGGVTGVARRACSRA